MKCYLCKKKADITYDNKNYCQSCFMNTNFKEENEEKINSKQSR